MRIRRVLCLMMAIFLVSALSVSAQQKRFEVPIGDSPALGPADAPVTIIEFLDYQ